MFDNCDISLRMPIEQVRSLVERCLPEGTRAVEVERFMASNNVRFTFEPKLSEYVGYLQREGAVPERIVIQVRIDNGAVIRLQIGGADGAWL